MACGWAGPGLGICRDMIVFLLQVMVPCSNDHGEATPVNRVENFTTRTMEVLKYHLWTALLASYISAMLGRATRGDSDSERVIATA